MSTTTSTSLASSTLGHEPTIYTPPTSTDQSTISAITETSGGSSSILTTSTSNKVTQATTALTQTSPASSSSSSTSNTNPPSVTSSSSRSLPIGSIIGGLVGALALILLFIILLLRHRASQKKNRPVEADTQVIAPFGFNFGERPGGYVSVNDGPRSRSRLSSPSVTTPNPANAYSFQATPLAPDSFAGYAFASNSNTLSIPPRKFGAHTTGAVHSPNQDEIIQLTTIHSSDRSPNQGHFQPPYSSNDLMNSSTREERASRTSKTSPDQAQFQTAFTNSDASSSHALDFAPPAYDSLSSHISYANSSRRGTPH